MKRFVLAAAVLLGGLVLAPAAFAHAHLQAAQPPVGGTVSAAPTEVVLIFSEAVEPSLCTVEVKDASGARFDAGAAHAGADGKHLAVGLKLLSPGVYTVEWHATSVDTHRTQGKFTFTIKP